MRAYREGSINKSQVVEQVHQVFKDYPELNDKFDSLILKGSKNRKRKRACQGQIQDNFAQYFMDKLKARFSEQDEIINQFMDEMNSLQRGEKGIEVIVEEILMLLRDHCDLQEDFRLFLDPGANYPQVTQKMIIEETESDDQSCASTMTPMPRYIHQPQHLDPLRDYIQNNDSTTSVQTPKFKLSDELDLFQRIQQQFKGTDTYKDLLHCMNLFNQDVLNDSEFDIILRDILDDDFYVEFKQFSKRIKNVDYDLGINLTPLEVSTQMNEDICIKDTPVRHLDLSKQPRDGASYYLLPKKYPHFIASHQTKIGDEVLNNNWINRTTGNEDFPFKSFKRTQYEEALFKFEDDRYDLEMFIERNRSTIKVVSSILQQAALQKMSQKSFNSYKLPQGVLKPFHFAHIRSLYCNGQGKQMQEAIKQQPLPYLKRLLPILQQQQTENEQQLPLMAPTWRRVFEINYQRSLDQRSFYWKQMDKKRYSLKNLSSQVNNLVDKRIYDSHTLLALPETYRIKDIKQVDQEMLYQSKLDHKDIFQDIYYLAQRFAAANNPQSQSQSQNDSYQKVVIFWLSLVDRIFDQDKKDLRQEIDSKCSTHHQYFHSPKLGKGRQLTSTKSTQRSYTVHQRSRNERMHRQDSVNKQDEAALYIKGSKTLEQVAKKTFGGDSELKFMSQSIELIETPSQDQNLNLTQEHDFIGRYQQFDTKIDVKTYTQQEDLWGILQKYEKQRNLNVFFSNTSLYGFFICHQQIYQRLALARHCCYEQIVNQYGNGLQQGYDQQTTLIEYESLYKQFLQKVVQLLEGSIDQQHFETYCRQHVGQNCYKLFTIDKMFSKICKGIVRFMTDNKNVHYIQQFVNSAQEEKIIEEFYLMRGKMIWQAMKDTQCGTTQSQQNFMRYYYNKETKSLQIQCLSDLHIKQSFHQRASNVKQYCWKNREQSIQRAQNKDQRRMTFDETLSKCSNPKRKFGDGWRNAQESKVTLKRAKPLLYHQVQNSDVNQFTLLMPCHQIISDAEDLIEEFSLEKSDQKVYLKHNKDFFYHKYQNVQSKQKVYEQIDLSDCVDSCSAQLKVQAQDQSLSGRICRQGSIQGSFEQQDLDQKVDQQQNHETQEQQEVELQVQQAQTEQTHQNQLNCDKVQSDSEQQERSLEQEPCESKEEVQEQQYHRQHQEVDVFQLKEQQDQQSHLNKQCPESLLQNSQQQQHIQQSQQDVQHKQIGKGVLDRETQQQNQIIAQLQMDTYQQGLDQPKKDPQIAYEKNQIQQVPDNKQSIKQKRKTPPGDICSSSNKFKQFHASFLHNITSSKGKEANSSNQKQFKTMQTLVTKY